MAPGTGGVATGDTQLPTGLELADRGWVTPTLIDAGTAGTRITSLALERVLTLPPVLHADASRAGISGESERMCVDPHSMKPAGWGDEKLCITGEAALGGRIRKGEEIHRAGSEAVPIRVQAGEAVRVAVSPSPPAPGVVMPVAWTTGTKVALVLSGTASLLPNSAALTVGHVGSPAARASWPMSW